MSALALFLRKFRSIYRLCLLHQYSSIRLDFELAKLRRYFTVRALDLHKTGLLDLAADLFQLMVNNSAGRLVGHVQVDRQVQRPDVAMHPDAAEQEFEEVCGDKHRH